MSSSAEEISSNQTHTKRSKKWSFLSTLSCPSSREERKRSFVRSKSTNFLFPFWRFVWSFFEEFVRLLFMSMLQYDDDDDDEEYNVWYGVGVWHNDHFRATTTTWMLEFCQLFDAPCKHQRKSLHNTSLVFVLWIILVHPFIHSYGILCDWRRWEEEESSLSKSIRWWKGVEFNKWSLHSSYSSNPFWSSREYVHTGRQTELWIFVCLVKWRMSTSTSTMAMITTITGHIIANCNVWMDEWMDGLVWPPPP